MVVKFPLLSEKAVDLIEKENKLVFVVERNSTKKEIKKAVEELYKVKVESVKTAINMRGQKRAFVKLNKKNNAGDLAVKLNII